MARFAVAYTRADGTTGRIEKSYRAYGAELESEFNVVEAGMAWGKVKDQDFIGKEAHVRHRDEEPAAIMCLKKSAKWLGSQPDRV